MAPPKKRKKVTTTSTAPAPAPAPTIPSIDEITEKDLPLLANVDKVKVHHYLMKLTTDFEQKTAKGTVILFLEWLQRPDNVADAKIILDACYLNVKDAYLLKRAEEYDPVVSLSEYNNSTGNRKNFYNSDPEIYWFGLENAEKLNASVDKWTIKLSGWTDFPSVVRIDYETLESSPSIHWRPANGFVYGESAGSCDNNNRCAYTPAPPVNNRGLFPCQEPPSVLSTWEVFIETEDCYKPLLTSDEPGEVLSTENGVSIHYFYTSIPLPMSTFAMVIGQFCVQTATLSSPEGLENENDNDDSIANKIEDLCKNHAKHPCRFSDPVKRQEKTIPLRLFSLDSECIPSLDLDKISDFVYFSLKTCHEKFGPHPFGRLDVVIMSKWFPHNCLASPSMIFLSPVNFKGENEPMFVSRIPHEISHSWFGLLIGNLDWTEEWLSEGFATFCEDIVFKETYRHYFPEKSEAEVKNELALKICLRFISLQTELANTDNELHVLSGAKKAGPNNGQPWVGPRPQAAAKDGLVPMKQFMLLHYTKGYFLLWHLALLVGEQAFVDFLKEYIWRYHGELVTSEIFLNCYYDAFQDLLTASDRAAFVGKFREAWLESGGLPYPLDFNAIEVLKSDLDLGLVATRPLFQHAANSVRKVQKMYKDLMAERVDLAALQRFTYRELCLLFDIILSTPDNTEVLQVIYKQLLRSQMFDGDEMAKHNPELAHSWCELVVLCKDEERISIVEKYLEDNMSMGVYLYQEFMLSKKENFQKLAKKIYHKLENLYDLGGKRIVKQFLKIK